MLLKDLQQHFKRIGLTFVCVCVLGTQAFTQLSRDSSPDVWRFSLLCRVRRCFGFQVFSRRSYLSSHHPL